MEGTDNYVRSMEARTRGRVERGGIDVWRRRRAKDVHIMLCHAEMDSERQDGATHSCRER